MGNAHLDELNDAQRAAATFGIPEGGPATPAPPLLIVAGAGTGKTGTLAHRTAHLILNGADPGRILLLTFTRRAAEAMARRAGRICGRALGTDTALDLEWAGTFHAMGARLLRLYAPAIGLDPAFTILDRSDAADLLDLVRDGLGSGTDRPPLPAQGHLPRHLLACREHAAPAGCPAAAGFSLVCRVAGRAEAPVRGLCRGEAAPVGPRL